MEQKRMCYRYSTAFKRKVVEEIESGQIGIEGARKLYDIHGTMTIRRWIEELGKHHLLNRVVRIEMKDEQDRLKALEKEKKALESALAQAHLKIIALETTVEVLEEKYGSGDKKKTDTGSSNVCSSDERITKEIIG